MISVVMTTYNGEKYLRKQIESILNQTLRPDELIIVDDNSSDSSYKIIEEFAKKFSFINIYRNNVNVGYKENFYKAITLAKGNVIFLSDQDDVWSKNKIETMSNSLSINKNIKVLNTAISLIDGKDKLIAFPLEGNKSNCNIINKKIDSNGIEKFNYPYIRNANISPGCTICFTSEVKDIFLEAYDFFKPHDGVINCIGALMNGLYFQNVELTMYRLHSTNTIGFSFLKKGKKDNLQKRIYIRNKEAYQDYKLADAINKKNKGNEFTDLCVNRYKAICCHSLRAYMNLIHQNMNCYKLVFSRKKRIVDFVSFLLLRTEKENLS